MPTALQRTRACISEARRPLPQELRTITSKIMREAFQGVETARNRARAELLARFSLTGDCSRG